MELLQPPNNPRPMRPHVAIVLVAVLVWNYFGIMGVLVGYCNTSCGFVSALSVGFQF